MKRGYMNWDKSLLPAEVLDKRRSEIVKAARRDGLDAVIIYGDVINADELVDMTNYGPYWCNTVAVLTAEGDYCLVTGHNARVNSWLSEMTGLPEDKLFPAGMRVAAKTAEVLQMLLPEHATIGVAGKYTLANIEAAIQEAGFSVRSVHKWFDYLLSVRDQAYVDTVKKGHIIMETAIESALESVAGKTVKQICADIEYALRTAGAMDVYMFVSQDGKAFTLPTEYTSNSWNLYINVQYLGVWLTFAFPVSSESDTAYKVLDRIAQNMDPKNMPQNVKIRNRILSDAFSSLNNMDTSWPAKGSVFTLSLTGESTYTEKMYLMTDTVPVALGYR